MKRIKPYSIGKPLRNDSLVHVPLIACTDVMLSLGSEGEKRVKFYRYPCKGKNSVMWVILQVILYNEFIRGLFPLSANEMKNYISLVIWAQIKDGWTCVLKVNSVHV